MARICLGIEGTAHTFGVGIVDDAANVLSNEWSMYVPEEGGIHPREAANHHTEIAGSVLRRAIENAGINRDDISLVAFSMGPGLGPCLRTAATAARTLSLSLDVPIVGVNHCIAHLEIGRAVCDCDDPVLLYVSGGNTQVISYANGKYRVFGETLDIGLGNMLDKFGREKGMPFPAGPELEKLAKNGEKLIELPYSVKGMDVSFSGLLTAALNCDEDMKDLSFSIQETAFSMLVEVTERAMAHLGKDQVLLGGGVVRNRRLVNMVASMCKQRGAKSYVPTPSLCSDNGAMIAWTGLIMNNAGISHTLEETSINQKFRTDDVIVTWI